MSGGLCNKLGMYPSRVRSQVSLMLNLVPKNAEAQISSTRLFHVKHKYMLVGYRILKKLLLYNVKTSFKLSPPTPPSPTQPSQLIITVLWLLRSAKNK